MKLFACLAALAAASSIPAQKLETQPSVTTKVIRVETARDQLTVIEVADPVTMVAVGNHNAYAVERRENKVFVRPAEDDARTNLFIWTREGRFAYELVPAASVDRMHFAIDHTPRVVAANREPSPPAREVQTPIPAEMLLRATPVSVHGERDTRSRVEVTMRDLYRANGRLFLRYAIHNRSASGYHPTRPAVWRMAGATRGGTLMRHLLMRGARRRADGGRKDPCLPNQFPGAGARAVDARRPEHRALLLLRVPPGNEGTNGSRRAYSQSMDIAQTEDPAPRKPLRLWPGVVAVVLQGLVWFVVPIVAPEATMLAVLGALGCGLAVVVWWLFFSRAPWSERVAAIVLMVVALAATSRIVHESIANGMMGMMLPIYAIPVLSLALVAWAVASLRLSTGLRRASLAGSILLACGVFTIIRTGGITGGGGSDLHWRWTPTPEERLLAQAGDEAEPLPSTRAAAPTPERPSAPQSGDEPTSSAPAPAVAKTPEKRGEAEAGEEPMAVATDLARPKPNAEWPGFRGPERDGIVRGAHIETDWSQSAPVELWRRPVGPGWSSFAVHGNLIYTQEQRGDEEFVSSYHLTTGAPVWSHRDAARFWESNAGAGPRGTPTLSNGRVYTFGATGILNALDARDGSVVWSRNAASDTGKKVPDWGFASSPLVAGDMVIIATAGVLAAYDLTTGNPRWIGPKGGWGYSSPHFATVDGVAQIVLLNGAGAIGVAPADGALLWKYDWRGDGIVQPAVIAAGDVLIGSGSGLSSGVGIRRIAVAHGPAGWSAQERWTSNGLKPYFNDFVVHKGYAFGFDGSIIACIDLEDGKRKWKGGRYGHGQMILLPDQELLLVLSEEGELALVEAAAAHFRELARFPAIEGKTWNHPVLVGDVLLVRNSQEMAAFRLSFPGR